MAKLKTFKVPVITTLSQDRLADDHAEGTAIMAVPGYSHIVRLGDDARSHIYIPGGQGVYGFRANAIIRATNREQVRRDVKAALGPLYQQGRHSVDECGGGR